MAGETVRLDVKKLYNSGILSEINDSGQIVMDKVSRFALIKPEAKVGQNPR
jgi:hypothetical protein